MSHDPIAWIQQQQDRHWARLASMPACTRSVILEPLRDIYAKRLAIVIDLVGVGGGLGMLFAAFAIRGPDGAGLEMGMFLLLFGIVLGFATACAVHAINVHKFLASRFWSIPMTKEQVDDLKSWMESYPPIQEACIKWGATRASLTLGSIEFARIAAIHGKVARLRDQLTAHLQAQEQARNSFDEIGLLSKIQSQRDHAELDSGCVDAVNTTTRPRL